MIQLLPCPFCGGEAEVEQEGKNRRSCIVTCSACGCRLESNEIGAGSAWNARAPTAVALTNYQPETSLDAICDEKGRCYLSFKVLNALSASGVTTLGQLILMTYGISCAQRT